MLSLRKGRPLLIAGLGAALLALGGAARAGDVENGRQLAGRLCTNCHIVSKDATGMTVPAGVPSFAAIANSAEQSAERIAGRIVVPHPPMPQIQVTRDEIGDLAAYIMSLRAE